MKKEGLKRTIINAFNNEFERRCVILVADAYLSAQEANCIDITCDEEYMSAVLFDYIDKSSQSVEWSINLAPEYCEYKGIILKKKPTKKNTPKISMKFGGWTNKINLNYFVETTNIIEAVRPQNKKSRFQNPVTISELHIHYITKIDNCLSNTYPVRGCIIAYILQGDAKYTVNCLNHYLCDRNKAPEILKKYFPRLKQLDACYFSTHGNCSIQHLMLDFSGNKTMKEKTENVTEN
jgi:hypothetical protein